MLNNAEILDLLHRALEMEEKMNLDLIDILELDNPIEGVNDSLRISIKEITSSIKTESEMHRDVVKAAIKRIEANE